MKNKCNSKSPCPQDENKAGWFHPDIIELEKINDTQTEWICLHCGYTYIDKSRNWPSYEDEKQQETTTRKTTKNNKPRRKKPRRKKPRKKNHK